MRVEVARVTGGVCDEAYRILNQQRLTEIELVGRGSRIRVPITRSRKKPDRHLTPEQVRRKKQSEKAKDRARKRLAAIFPDLYETLVAEERAEMGLEPWPVERAVKAADPSVDIGFAELAAELERHEVDPS